MRTRRRLLQTPGVGAMLAGLGLAFPRVFTTEAEAQSVLNLSTMLPEGTRAEAILDTLPGKKPLIKLTYRPPLSTIKTLAGFDFSFQPPLDKNRIMVLAELK